MSAGPGAQSADISAPLSPLAPPFHQHQAWQHGQHGQHGQHEISHSQNYDPFSPTATRQYMNSQPYRDAHYAVSPYAGYGGFHPPTYFPPSTFSYASHQPRPPPAIRSGPVDALVGSGRSGGGEQFARNEQYESRGAPSSFYPYHTSYQGLSHSAIGHSPYSMPNQPATMPHLTPSEPSTERQAVPTTRSGGIEQSRQTLPRHQRPMQSNQYLQLHQRQQRPTSGSIENRNSDDTERRSSTNLTAQGRRSDRSSSPSNSARRSFDRYSWDSLHTSTSSDVEEAAARLPPSNRIRHRPREGRPRFFSQHIDPNFSTGRQVQELKASLPKLLAGELPKDTSPTCDICAKDYSATCVQPSEEEEVAVQLSCGHSFGEFCIGQWVRKLISNTSLS